MAILLDVYLGVPVIYSTFMQYDELGHHFGPSSFQALRDLRRTDARLREIRRMIAQSARRQYDLVILSDHGMTPSTSFRVRFGESLGRTVERILEGDARRTGERPLRSSASFTETSEYADVGAQIVEAVAQVTPQSQPRSRRLIRRFRDWVRRKYGLRELILPEKYRVGEDHDVVVTYSSCLALVYFVEDQRALSHDDILRDQRRSTLYEELIHHPGIGLLATRAGSRGDTGVHLEGRSGRARIDDGVLTVLEGENPLELYGTDANVLRAVEHLVSQPNTGDIVLFGAYDGYDIVSFDDQIGAHGSAGGPQLFPFIIGPAELNLDAARLDDARDLHGAIMTKYGKAGMQATVEETTA
jgi:hypothetical protein